ncbi:TPA: hypothetical protein HA318_05425 [Candidatus Micrarchaeota archaeon]|nr:hypothetical protein [Candidatus Micrarchaeota archaeon]
MNIRQRRGQAFETMMLVISVIVALAILGVLMNILGGIGGGIGSDPKQAIKQKVEEQAGKPGATSPIKTKVTVTELRINKLDVLGGTTLSQDEFEFLCDPAIEVGEPLQCDDTSDSRVTLQKGDYYVVACGNPDAAVDVKYRVGIGKTAGSADEVCDLASLD